MSEVGLTRFWINFVAGDGPGLSGCGVTAYNELDAKSLLEEELFPVLGVREIAGIIPDVDIRTLDQGHVIPNMAPPNFRGVWFPKLT